VGEQKPPEKPPKKEEKKKKKKKGEKEEEEEDDDDIEADKELGNILKNARDKDPQQLTEEYKQRSGE